MGSLLIEHIAQLVTCDGNDRILQDVDLYAENGVIRAIGPNLGKTADVVLSGRHMLCYPGLVNTHHHLYQQFSRNLPQVQDMELFDWLKTLYEIWKNLDADVIRLSSQTGMGELMKYGCTTCFDHHYVFPRRLRRPDRRTDGGSGRARHADGLVARIDGSECQGRRPPARLGRTDRGRNYARFDGGH